jgi:tetratricopeptide (TPR) repeat protein
LVTGAPTAIFILLEVALGFSSAVRSTDFFIPDSLPGIYRTNPRFTETFFPASFGLTPLNFRLPKEKPPGSVRVFVLGESAALGMPEPGFGMAPQVEAQLRATYPGKKIEVYNLAVTAINSHVILKIARQAIYFHPDLLIVYMGNNEVVGPSGPGATIAGWMPPLFFIRAGLWARGTHTGQFIQRLAQSRRGLRNWGGMEMFSNMTVEPDDPRMERVYGNFSENLSDLLQLAKRAGVTTILSTVAVNVRDCAPFASHLPSAWNLAQIQEWQVVFDRAADIMSSPDKGKARPLLEQLLRRNPRHAGAHFLLAKIFDGEGALDEARKHYLQALELDGLRFRADARINDMIRKTADEYSGTVLLADAARELGSDMNSREPPAGRDLFFEHVHFNWEGNFRLSHLLAQVAGVGLFGETPRARPFLAVGECTEAMGYTTYGRYKMVSLMNTLTARPPFTKQLTFATDRAELEKVLAATESILATPGILSSIAASIEKIHLLQPSNSFLIFELEEINASLGNLTRALALNEKLLSLQPPSPVQLAHKAYLLTAAGRFEEAERVLLKSAQDNPYYTENYNLLVELWYQKGALEKARKYFENLARQMPGNRIVQLDYAEILHRSRDEPAAEQQRRRVLLMAPDEEAALAPCVQQLYQKGEIEAALQLMLNAYIYNPRNFTNNGRLAQVYADRGDLEQEVKYMKAIAESGPVNGNLYLDLADRYSKLKRPDEVLVALWKARERALDDDDQTMLSKIDEAIRTNSRISLP